MHQNSALEGENLADLAQFTSLHRFQGWKVPDAAKKYILWQGKCFAEEKFIIARIARLIRVWDKIIRSQ